MVWTGLHHGDGTYIFNLLRVFCLLQNTGTITDFNQSSILCVTLQRQHYYIRNTMVPIWEQKQNIMAICQMVAWRNKCYPVVTYQLYWIQHVINVFGHSTLWSSFCSVMNLGVVAVSVENGTNVFQTHVFDIRWLCAIMEIVVCYILCVRAMVRSRTQNYSIGICCFSVMAHIIKA